LVEENMKASVVIVTYRRMSCLHQIVSSWCAQSSDVWLCDCSAGGVPQTVRRIPGLNYVHFVPDPGNKVRHAVALLTDGDIVIKADDDILPLPGLADDFLHWYDRLGEVVMGIHGRTFEGPDYYRDTVLYAGHMQKEPRRVDFLGVITCAPRQFLPMDLRGCESPIEDLWWHNQEYPRIAKYVIPTKAYNNKLPESRDVGRLCAGGEERVLRRQFYRKLYEESYR